MKTIIIGLGGSIIIPAPGRIDVRFLKKFRQMILKFLKTGQYRFIIVAGGGKTCRIYQKAAVNTVKTLPNIDADWLGIYATRLNAQLLKTIFGKHAYPDIIENPTQRIKNKKWSLLLAAGWMPGWSTDYDAVLLAKRFGVNQIIDAGNIPFVYNKDYRRYKNTFPIKRLRWKEYRKLIGRQWTPGMSAPIDPIAAKYAEAAKIRAVVIMGTKLKNFENLLMNRPFVGTIIEF